jgi:hypothetical protein
MACSWTPPLVECSVKAASNASPSPIVHRDFYEELRESKKREKKKETKERKKHAENRHVSFIQTCKIDLAS